ncbi:hypothetical protein ACLB2K_055264 [Fragaria x ananassa]
MLLRLNKQILFALLGGLSLILLVHAQDEDQSGFVDTGESKLVLRYVKDFYQQPYWGVRSFPEGIRNCYKINVTTGDKYLIRVSFVYGNYDGKGKLPTFLLYLGTNLWDSVKVQNESYVINKELNQLIHVAPQNYIHVCLVNNGSGVPFISPIELRPLNVTSYPTQTGSLALNWRLDIGQTGPDLKSYRYPKDIHDRFWDPYEDVDNVWFTLNTSSTVDFDDHNLYEPASVVMSTAATAKNATDPLMLRWDPPVDANDTKYYVYMHFAEIEVQANESRWQYITNNGKPYMESFAASYLYTTTIYSTKPQRGSQNFSIIKAENSTLPPSINGLEIYTLKEFLELETNQDDDKTSDVLTWEGRLQIATEAAQVKSSNSKLSDFGLSRNFAPGDRDGTHIVTGVAGTPGFLAPEYHQSNRLNEKSDVYSFGIVLLEIITGRPVYTRTNGERTHITRWVELMLPRGDIYSIIDPMLERNFNVNSAWKAVETAMACVSAEPSKRPVMSTVVMELKECLASQLDLTNFNSEETALGSSSIYVSQNNSIMMMRPSVR